MGNKLYVGNLPYSVRDNDLEQAFGQFGAVTSAKVMMERDTGRSKGFGFVEMASDAEAQAAIEGMNGQSLGGRSVVVNEARPMEARPPRSGGFGGGGGGGYGGGGGAAAAVEAGTAVSAAPMAPARVAVAAGEVAAAAAVAAMAAAVAAVTDRRCTSPSACDNKGSCGGLFAGSPEVRAPFFCVFGAVPPMRGRTRHWAARATVWPRRPSATESRGSWRPTRWRQRPGRQNHRAA